MGIKSIWVSEVANTFLLFTFPTWKIKMWERGWGEENLIDYMKIEIQGSSIHGHMQQ